MIQVVIRKYMLFKKQLYIPYEGSAGQRSRERPAVFVPCELYLVTANSLFH